MLAWIMLHVETIVVNLESPCSCLHPSLKSGENPTAATAPAAIQKISNTPNHKLRQLSEWWPSRERRT